MLQIWRAPHSFGQNLTWTEPHTHTQLFNLPGVVHKPLLFWPETVSTSICLALLCIGLFDSPCVKFPTRISFWKNLQSAIWKCGSDEHSESFANQKNSCVMKGKQRSISRQKNPMRKRIHLPIQLLPPHFTTNLYIILPSLAIDLLKKCNVECDIKSLASLPKKEEHNV